MSKYRIAESLILITTLPMPMAYTELYPYPGGGTRAIGWAFIFGSYDTLQNRFVFYDPAYLLSFGSIVFIVSVSVWLIINACLVRLVRKLPEDESGLSRAWLYVLVAFVSQMILPGILLQRLPASHYGFVLPIPTQSVIAIVALIMRGVPSVPEWVTITTFLTPFGVGAFRTLIFDSGLAWYFPFWQFVHGTGEGGGFTRLGTFGLGGFLPLPLEILMSAILVTTGIVLAEVLHRAKNDVEWYTIGWKAASVGLLIQIIMPLLVISFLWGWVYMPVIPIPSPSILTIVGLMMIRKKRNQ